MLEMLFGNSVAAAGLALLVLLFGRCFRPGPATRHALWFLVVLKLLSPVGLLWKESLPFEQPKFLADADEGHASPVAIAKPRQIEVQRFVWVRADPNDVDANANAEFLSANVGAGNNIVVESPMPSVPTLKQSLNFWFLIIWLAGAIVVAGRYFQRTLRFARYARSGKEASPSLQRQVAYLAARLGVRPPLVRVLPDLPSPVVWSLFRPVLLWPKGLQDQLSGDGRQTVIVHELAHLLRKDHWFRWLELAAAVVHWWNPIFWLARRQMRFHAELACDAWVTGMLPENRRAYAEALLEVCSRTTRAAAPSPAVGVGGDGRRDFQRRLTMIMRDRVPCRLAAGAKMFVVLLAVAALPAWTLGQAKPVPKVEVEVQQGDVQSTGVAVADFDNDGYLDLFVQNLDGKIEWQLTGPADAQKIKALQAQIDALNQQLKAMRLAREATDKIRHREPLQFKVRTIQIGEDGKMIGIGNDAKRDTLFLYRMATPEQKQIHITVGADGKPVVVGNEKNWNTELRLWDPKTGKPLIAPPIPQSVEGKRVIGVAFSPDGKLLAVGEEPKPAPAINFTQPVPVQRFRVEVVGPDDKPPQYKVIGADGKEIKDIQILIDRLQVLPTLAVPGMKPVPPLPVLPPGAAPPVALPQGSAPLMYHLYQDEAEMQTESVRHRLAAVKSLATVPATGKVVTLTRSTYKLSKEKAEALAAFLKTNIKAPVLETKVEGDGLTVTTTPDVQATVSGIVKLIQDQGGDKPIRWHFNTMTPAK